MGFIRWGGKKFYPQKPKPYKPDINELMKPLSEKVGKGNIWGSQIMNVEKDGGTPTPPPSTDPDYQAVLDYATLQGYTLPSASGQTLQNDLVVELKSAGIWSDLDIFYVMATDGDEDFAKLNWKQPSSFNLVENGSVNFITNVGFQNDIAVNTNYLDTQFDPSLYGSGYTLNDAARILWDYDATPGGQNIFDGGTTTRWRGDFNTTQRINQGNTNLPTAFDNTGLGFKMMQRTSSSNVNMYNNSSTPTSFVVSSTIVDVGTLRLFRAATLTSWRKLSVYGVGASLSSKENDILTALTTYMNGL